MFPSRLPTHKCRICGVEVEIAQARAHYRTTHPEYEQWGNHWKRLFWLLLIFDMALVMSRIPFNLLVSRSVILIFDYVVMAYLLGSVMVMIFIVTSKQRAFREAWRKTHGSSSSQ